MVNRLPLAINIKTRYTALRPRNAVYRKVDAKSVEENQSGTFSTFGQCAESFRGHLQQGDWTRLFPTGRLAA